MEVTKEIVPSLSVLLETEWSKNIVYQNAVKFFHFYIGQPCRFYEVDEDAEGRYCILTPKILQRHLDDPDQTFIRLCLKRVDMQAYRQTNPAEPMPFMFARLILEGYDIFHLIKYGHAIDIVGQYE